MIETEDLKDGDERYHLPRGEPVLTPERIAKGDLEYALTESGNLRFAQAQLNTVLNFLWVGKILTQQHVHDGQTFEIWQICFTSEFQIKENRIYATELERFERAIRADGLDVALFDKILHQLTTQQKKMIEYALSPGTTDHKRWLAIRYQGHYRKAFDRLSEIMENLRNEYQAAYEARLNAK